MGKHFIVELRWEIAPLVVDKGYSVRAAAEAMNIGKSAVDRWSRQLRQERGGEAPPPRR